MPEPNNERRWFQVSLKSLLLLTLVVAAYFAGVATMIRQAEAVKREAREQVEAAVKQEQLAHEQVRFAEYRLAILEARVNMQNAAPFLGKELLDGTLKGATKKVGGPPNEKRNAIRP